MQSFSSRVSVQMEGTQNVLVIELQEGQALIPYCCKMMEGNNIPGLLPMRHQTMDGIVRLRYNIGGKVPLREFMLQHHLTHQNGIQLLRNLSTALLHLHEYFLSVDMCYLDPEYIYIGDGLNPYLACVPLQQPAGMDRTPALKKFYEKLLSDYFAAANDPGFVEMFMWVYRANLFDLETFYRQFLQEDQAAPAPKASPEAPAPVPARPPQPVQAAPAPVPAPAATPAPARSEEPKAGLLQKTAKAVKSAVEPARPAKAAGDLPFAIPGAPAGAAPAPQPPAPAPAAPKAKQTGDSRKGFLSFGKRGKKEKENTASFAIPDQMEASPVPPIPAAPPAPVPPPAPPAPEPPVSAPQPGPAAPAVGNDEWESGTILVGAPKPQADPTPARDVSPAGAWFLHNGQKVAITETPFLVGKYNTSCHLHYAIYDNSKVSRSHATFLFEKGHYLIRDNQSRNGTFLNGQALLPLHPVELKDGDEIKLYDEVLIFHTV